MVYILKVLPVVVWACSLLDCHCLFGLCTCTDVQWLPMLPTPPMCFPVQSDLEVKTTFHWIRLSRAFLHLNIRGQVQTSIMWVNVLPSSSASAGYEYEVLSWLV